MVSRLLQGLFVGSILALGPAVQAAPDVNQASLAELESLPGIGPGTSGRILGERQKGPFKDWADLIGRVKGLGAASAARLSAAGLTVDGASYAVADKAGSAPAAASR